MRKGKKIPRGITKAIKHRALYLRLNHPRWQWQTCVDVALTEFARRLTVEQYDGAEVLMREFLRELSQLEVIEAKPHDAHRP